MPPNEKPVAAIRRPRVNASAIDAIGARWEQRSPGEPVPANEPQDVGASERPVVQASAGVPSGPVLVPAPTAPAAAAHSGFHAPPVTMVVPSAPAPVLPADGDPSEALGRGIVKRVGRQLADGSRKGARALRRMTVYIEPERASQLAVRFAQTGENMSDIIDRALAAYLQG